MDWYTIELFVGILLRYHLHYKELERLLKLSDIKMSVDKVLDMAKTITTISVYMPQNKTHFVKTMPMKRHKPIAKLFEKEFWEAQ